jgi:ABC-type lipoprotein release transport system permease subunit
MMAVVIGVWSMIFMGGFQRGMISQMVENGISTLTGHIQVHHKGYRNDPAIENSMANPGVVEHALEKHLPPGALWASRVRVNAVASNARHSGGVTMVGMDPSKEAKVSFIGQAVHEGAYLSRDDEHGIVVGKALVEKFETELGHKLVLMSQDTEGDIASRAFRIVGIFESEMEATEKQFIFVTLGSAQDMLKLKNGISEFCIVLPDRHRVRQVADELARVLPASQYEVHTWRELLPLVDAYLSLFDVFIFIWFLVVFIAMGFGIVNTTLMAVFERVREFGLLKALGMKPWWIIRSVLTESFLLLVMGMAVGNALGLLSVFALSSTGIDLSSFAAGAEFAGISRVIYPVISTRDVITANLVVFVLGLLVSIYPAAKAARFTPVEALAHT